jgi:hypothetical protein
MTDHDLYLETPSGSVAISITALDEGAQSEAEDVAALLTQEYGDRLRER